MDLIYTNSARVDQGVLQDYELDLAFGADENNLECKVQAGSHCCESGSLLYIEGTEYGGIIDSIESDTDSKEVIYTGRTWHGILNSKVIQPDSGEAYLVLNGEANAVIADLLSRLALTDLFEASSEDSGLNIKNYKMNRYISGYDGILKMLKTVGGKLKLTFSDGKVVLAAEAVHDYTQDEEFDADQVPFRAKRNFKGVNHLICLGSGQLEERMVVHLYADTEGNISREQTQFGLDEVCTIYEYSNVETEDELVQEGMDKFKSLMAEDEIAIDFDADSDTYDVGDIIGAVDNITGLAAHTTIAKKIVTIKNGKITISLTPDKAKEGSSYEGSGNGGGESVDAYTKAETIDSEVRTMLGLESDATPADAFKALKTIMFCPQIVVSSAKGSTVTCRKGDTILFADEVDGKWTFNVTDYGEWTVTASLGAASNSAKVQVCAVCQMPVEVAIEYATIFVTGLDRNSTVRADLRKPNPDSKGLPSGYTQLEYIKSTGVQYFDTKYVANSKTEMICEVSADSGETFTAGSRIAAGNNAFIININGTNQTARFLFANDANPHDFSVSNINQKHKYAMLGNGQYFVDDELKVSLSGTLSSSLNVYVFKINMNGSVAGQDAGAGTLYTCQIKENGVLVRNYIPAKRNSDGAIGVYDIVNNGFYQSLSGAFIAGAEVPKYDGYVEGKTVNGKWLSAEESGRFTTGHPECIVSTANYLLYTFNQSGSLRNYKKAYADEAYVCSFVRSDGIVVPLLVGKTADSAAYYTDGNHSSGVLKYSTTVEYLGETWYLSGTGASYQSNLGSISASNVIHLNTVLGKSFASVAEAALAFLEYAAPKPVGGFAIEPITDYGTWTVTATDGSTTKTQDVLVEEAVEYSIEMG